MTSSPMPPRVTQSSAPWSDKALRNAVVGGIGVIAVLEVTAELIARRQRAKFAVNGWWARVERRERHDLHKAGIAYLAHGLRPRSR